MKAGEMPRNRTNFGDREALQDIQSPRDSQLHRVWSSSPLWYAFELEHLHLTRYHFTTASHGTHCMKSRRHK